MTFLAIKMRLLGVKRGYFKAMAFIFQNDGVARPCLRSAIAWPELAHSHGSSQDDSPRAVWRISFVGSRFEQMN
jgi:hypothetical protein